MIPMGDFVAKAIAAGNVNGRQTVGMSAAVFTDRTGQTNGKLVKKTGNAKGGTLDPSAGTKNDRSHCKTTASAPTCGAAYRIGARLPGNTSPEAGYTQANGRILKPTGGQSGNFWSAQV